MLKPENCPHDVMFTLFELPLNVATCCFSSPMISARPFFFFNDTATTEIYTLSLHDALPISAWRCSRAFAWSAPCPGPRLRRSEEHTSELQSLRHLVCRLLLEKKKRVKNDRNRVSAQLDGEVPVSPQRVG